MAVLFEVKLKDEWFKENIMRPIRGRRPGMTRPTRGGVNPRRPGMTRPMPTRGGVGMNPIRPGNTNVRTASPGMKKGGKVKKHRGDGCCMKGKTKGRMV